MSNHKNDVVATAGTATRRVVFTIAAFAIFAALFVVGSIARSDAAAPSKAQGISVSSCKTGNYSSYSGGFCDKRQGHGRLPKWFKVASRCGMGAAFMGPGAPAYAVAGGFGACAIGGPSK